jgi:hypothetical protein
MLVARSSPECHLYMQLHPCSCGDTRSPRKHRLLSTDDGLVAHYDEPCPACGKPRVFDFQLDPEIPPGVKFGGANPSTIIDAGQFLAEADRAARSVPGDTSTLDADDRTRARLELQRAVDALEEVIKFVPDGADRVPAESLFTGAGKEIYLREPGRFRKARLEAVLGVYRELAAKL